VGVSGCFITLVENPMAKGLPSKVGGHGVNKSPAYGRRFINTRPPTLLDRPLARGFPTNVMKPLQLKNIKEPSCLQVVIEHPGRHHTEQPPSSAATSFKHPACYQATSKRSKPALTSHHGSHDHRHGSRQSGHQSPVTM
jgi:hypothetical protein